MWSWGKRVVPSTLGKGSSLSIFYKKRNPPPILWYNLSRATLWHLPQEGIFFGAHLDCQVLGIGGLRVLIWWVELEASKLRQESVKITSIELRRNRIHSIVQGTCVSINIVLSNPSWWGWISMIYSRKEREERNK